jgi:hypothetical protein
MQPLAWLRAVLRGYLLAGARALQIVKNDIWI